MPVIVFDPERVTNKQKATARKIFLDVSGRLQGWISLSVCPRPNGQYDLDFGCIVDGHKYIFYSSTIKKGLHSIPKLEESELNKATQAGVDFLIEMEKRNEANRCLRIILDWDALSTSFKPDESQPALLAQTNPPLPPVE